MFVMFVMHKAMGIQRESQFLTFSERQHHQNVKILSAIDM